MNILVTGSTGFVGSTLCRALVGRGYTVRAFHRSTSDLRLLEGLPVEHVLGDLTQPQTIQAAMPGIDAIFHAAAWVGMNDLGRLYAVTVEGTRTVIQAALKAGVRRLVYTSSIAALGFPAPGEISLIDEHRTWNSRPEFFPYGYAKYLAELEVQKGVAQGLDAVIVNPGLILGAGDIYRQSSSIIRQIANRKLGVTVEGGSNVIHVADVADGQIAALERGRTGERYILGGFNVTHLELACLIARVTGVSLPTVVLPGGLVRALRGVAHLLERFLEIPVSPDVFILAGCYLYCNPAKARTQLNLPEPRPLEQAIAEAHTWFQGRN
jgi:dihydroflavonol-4-reductase